MTECGIKRYKAALCSAGLTCLYLVLCGCVLPERFFISTDHLTDSMHYERVVVIDARSPDTFKKGHIPGARSLWWQDFCASGPPWKLGSHGSVSAQLEKAGISGTEYVVLYDAGGWQEPAAGYIAWILLYMGIQDVHILDGGFNKWEAESRQIETGTMDIAPAVFSGQKRQELLASTQDVRRAAETGDAVIVDVRPDAHYNGWKLFNEPRGGHILGAVHVPVNEWFSDELTLKPREHLLDIWKEKGISAEKSIIFYSTFGLQSGFACCVAEYLGYESYAQYDGSFYEWADNSSLPVREVAPDYSMLYPVSLLREDVSNNNDDIVILDCRSRDRYESGHIPGAVHMQWEKLSNSVLPNNLFDSALMKKTVGNHAITGSETLVIYSDVTGSWGGDGRLLWSLEYLGHSDVRILNGGFYAWERSGGMVETDTCTFKTAVYSGSVDSAVYADKKYVCSVLENDSAVIIDARTDSEYAGAALYGEARGGRIPGAVQINYDELFDTDRTLKDPDTLYAGFIQKGVTREKECIVYCTSGIRSAYLYFVLKLLGYPRVRNFDGSWYEWAADAEMPAEK